MNPEILTFEEQKSRFHTLLEKEYRFPISDWISLNEALDSANSYKENVGLLEEQVKRIMDEDTQRVVERLGRDQYVELRQDLKSGRFRKRMLA